MRVILLVPFVTLFLSACSEDDPPSSTWNYVGSEPLDDTCGLEGLYVDSPGTFTLIDNGDDTITIDDGTNEFDCSLDGQDFACPSRLSGEKDIGSEYGLDAVILYNVVATGSFSTNNDEMNGRQEVTIECVGADCQTFETVSGVDVPCGWAQDFTATRS